MKIRYYGHMGQATGYGKAAEDLCLALHRVGVELEIRSLAPPDQVAARVGLPLAPFLRNDRDLDPCPDVILVHTLPADCGRVLEVIGHGRRQHEHDLHGGVPRLVCYTTWETDRMPAEVRGSIYSRFDDVWTPSAASAASFGARARVVPHCFEEATLTVRRTYANLPPLDLPPPRFRFYCVGAWTGRKNMMGLVRSYAEAFTADDPVELLIHASNADQSVADRLAPIMERANAPRIAVTGGWMTDEALATFHGHADCFVTASHGEAWNLPAFDAMLAGRMIIAPGRQGSDEFLCDTSAVLFEAGPLTRRLEPGEANAEGITSRVTWNDAPNAQLVAAMRAVAKAKVRDLRIDYDPAEWFGYTRVGRLALNYLQELQK